MNKKQFKIYKKKIIFFYLISVFIICVFFIFGNDFFQKKVEKDFIFENSVNLLAVSFGENKTLKNGHSFSLNLKIKEGTGKVFLNLDNVVDEVVQVSLSSSKKISCEVFVLNCSNYDFYFEFENNPSIFLEGSSAGLAFAILVAKTLNFEKINPDMVFTGSLNSGGIIGIVGGIEEKLEVSKKYNFKKIFIPKGSKFNSSKFEELNIIRSLDVVEVYNEISSNKFLEKKEEINFSSYNKIMVKLKNSLCDRKENLILKVENLTELNLTNLTLIKKLEEEKKYYSLGSFCFRDNIKLQEKIFSNLSEEDKKKLTENFTLQINKKYEKLISNEFTNEITSLNKAYSYMILIDRIYSIKKVLQEENISNPMILSFLSERYNTVELWERFFDNFEVEKNFNKKNIFEACKNLNLNLIKKEKYFPENIFSKSIEEIKNFVSKEEKAFSFLCLYKGLELDGRMNAILNSPLDENQSEEFYINFLELIEKKFSKNREENFPLIPYIYFEYAQNLYNEDKQLSFLYANSAISFSNLNLLLK